MENDEKNDDDDDDDDPNHQLQNGDGEIGKGKWKDIYCINEFLIRS